jgi:N-carbamoylputrescine amidase
VGGGRPPGHRGGTALQPRVHLVCRGGYQPLRRKFYLPQEPGGWEATWFERGDARFPRFQAGTLDFGLSICTEIWALDTHAGYADLGVQALLTPRATAAATTAKWLAVGTVAAVRTGAYSLSSNRVDTAARTYGGAGWAISPDGALLARTTVEQPFCTVNVDLELAAAARSTYPRYVFAAPASAG